ncbi:hypothetical protein BKG96_03275 [Rodentibacter caecimuris]|uniref:Uncharacterized protein n=1 Tax=Rodentibacter caecimuris TaxID=1796644 RepID=A0A1V3KN47_9PAST|nr:hypothetical protein [Rodentibacter heylii]OOF79097.1 hypothetical protein BKG96_03275 [Rodentibacter heylii]
MTPTNEKKQQDATLAGIEEMISRIEAFSSSAVAGHVSAVNPDGTQTPMEPIEIFDLINEMANLALMDIQALRQELERLTIYHESKDKSVCLPVVDLKGDLTQ